MDQSGSPKSWYAGTRRSGRGFSSRPLGGNSLALNASHGMDYKVFVALQ